MTLGRVDSPTGREDHCLRGAVIGINRTKGDHVADEHKQQVKQEKKPVLKRPDEAIKDLEPEKDEGDAVKGGGTDIFVQLPPDKG